MNNSSKVYDVLVVGCGASGIAAITRLFQDGVSVLGLEGSNRIGGRIHSVEFGDNIIDLGGQWCHGEEGNIVYSMAKDLDLLEHREAAKTFTMMHSNGYVLPKEVNDKIPGLYMKVMDEGDEIMKNRKAPLGVLYMELFNKFLKTPEYSVIDPATGQLIVEMFAKYQNTVDASDTWFDTSSEGLLNYVDCPGDPLLHWKGRGYKTILDVMMKKIPNPAEELPIDILFNKEVTNINIIDKSTGNTTVQVKCKDGSVYTGKHVIVTVSLGVLKARYLELFTQPLPQSKVMSIQGLGFGPVDKIFFLYETAWWPSHFRWIGLLWTDEDKAKFIGEDKWLTEVFGFNVVEAQSSLLSFWVTGPVARYVETLPLDTVKDGLCRLVQQFFGKLYSIPPLKEVKRSQWFTNELVRGSYSFRSVGSETLGANQKDLGAPVLNDAGTPVICFAGEATSVEHFSTVHGAIGSGYREAERLKSHLKPKRNIRSNL